MNKIAGPSPIQLFTIGFTQHTAEQFFSKLQAARVQRLIDTRLNNTSQLAGFAKGENLKYFLRVIAGIEYQHDLQLAPTPEMLKAFQQGVIDWEEYSRQFKELLQARAPERQIAPSRFHHACLLCSEHEADYCHRRLVAEHLQQRWPELSITHL